jgi:hypothetical protein
MTISSYNKDGATLYRARVQIQSTRYPEIRPSEQVSGIKTLAEAEKINAKLEKEIQRKVIEMEARRTVTGQTWAGVLEHWYETQKRIRVPFGSISETTLNDYYQGLKKWMAVFDYTPCADISSLNLMELFNSMTDKGVSLGHRRTLRTKIKAVFDHGMQAGLVNI